MDNTYWHKQTSNEPLFPELAWSRPENKRFAGKLLIIGGNVHGFAAPAEAYQSAEKYGIGTINVVLPDAIQKLVSGFFENAFFGPSTPSGSFSQASLSEMLEQSAWADGVLLAGDLGRNAETAIVLEKFAQKYSGQLIVTKDAVDYFRNAPKQLLARPNTTIVASLSQLQKIAVSAHFTEPVTLGMDLLNLIETLRIFTSTYDSNLITKYHDQMIVACQGKVSTTKLLQDMPIWRVQTAAAISVWWIQNPSKTYEALTTAILEAVPPSS